MDEKLEGYDEGGMPSAFNPSTENPNHFTCFIYRWPEEVIIHHEEWYVERLCQSRPADYSLSQSGQPWSHGRI